jgi:hypothetical protein
VSVQFNPFLERGMAAWLYGSFENVMAKTKRGTTKCFYLPTKKKVARAIARFDVGRLLDLFDVS